MLESLQQLVAADRLDVLAQIVAGRPLDLGKPGGGRVAQRLVAGKLISAVR